MCQGFCWESDTTLSKNGWGGVWVWVGPWATCSGRTAAFQKSWGFEVWQSREQRLWKRECLGNSTLLLTVSAKVKTAAVCECRCSRDLQNVARVGQREVDVVGALLLLQQCIFAWLGSVTFLAVSFWCPFSDVGVQGCFPHHPMTGALLSRGQPGC